MRHSDYLLAKKMQKALLCKRIQQSPLLENCSSCPFIQMYSICISSNLISGKNISLIDLKCTSCIKCDFKRWSYILSRVAKIYTKKSLFKTTNFSMTTVVWISLTHMRPDTALWTIKGTVLDVPSLWALAAQVFLQWETNQQKQNTTFFKKDSCNQHRNLSQYVIKDIATMGCGRGWQLAAGERRLQEDTVALWHRSEN